MNPSDTARGWRRLTTTGRVVLAFTVAVSLAACSGSPSSSSSTPKTSTITVVVSPSPSDTALRSLAPDFTKATGIKVKFVEYPYDSLHEKEALAIRATQGAYDVIQFDDPYLPAFASAGFLTKLGTQIAGSAAYDSADFPKPIQDYGKYKGTDVAVPLSTEPFVMVYRPDLLHEVGVPTPRTWNDYLTAAQKVNALARGTYGSAMGYVTPKDSWWWLQILWSMGGDWADASLHPTVNSPTAVQALELYKQLLALSPKSAINNGGDDTAAAFGNSNIGLSVQYAGYYSTLTDPKQSKYAKKMAFAAVPSAQAQVTQLAGWLLGIPSDSAHKAESWRFIEWMLGRSNAIRFAETGAPPPARFSTMQDATLVQKYPQFPSVLAGAEHGRPLPQLPAWPQIQDAIGTQIGNVLTGQTSTQAGLNALQNQLRTILKNAGYPQ